MSALGQLNTGPCPDIPPTNRLYMGYQANPPAQCGQASQEMVGIQDEGGPTDQMVKSRVTVTIATVGGHASPPVTVLSALYRDEHIKVTRPLFPQCDKRLVLMRVVPSIK